MLGLLVCIWKVYNLLWAFYIWIIESCINIQVIDVGFLIVFSVPSWNTDQGV